MPSKRMIEDNEANAVLNQTFSYLGIRCRHTRRAIRRNVRNAVAEEHVTEATAVSIACEVMTTMCSYHGH